MFESIWGVNNAVNKIDEFSIVFPELLKKQLTIAEVHYARDW